MSRYLTNDGYFVVISSSGRAVLRFETQMIADAFIYNQKHPQDYYSASRYALSKSGLYPRNKAGNEKLVYDLMQIDIKPR